MKTMIFGGKGYLGQQFLTLFPDASMPSVDIADREAVRALLEKEKPEVVINCAGKTGRPNVDWCETHKLETIRSNVTGALIVMEECGRVGAYLVQLGSGCIYSGDNGGRGFGEEDPPNFSGSFYARTKAWVDQIFKEFPVLTLRLRMPFDGSLSDRNLIMKLRRYDRILDVQNSITALPDFLRASKTLIEKRRTGLYNITNTGTISPYEVMERYRAIVDPSHHFERLTLQDLSQVVTAGRSNCVLDTAKLAEEGIRMPSVTDAVDAALREINAMR
jgi:dTDP-4-dehydrorhamnose reductase